MAFANECLDRMKEESVRNHIEGLINIHLFAMANVKRAAELGSGEDKGRNWEEVG